jgi:hypothetical protein
MPRLAGSSQVCADQLLAGRNLQSISAPVGSGPAPNSMIPFHRFTTCGTRERKVDQRGFEPLIAIPHNDLHGTGMSGQCSRACVRIPLFVSSAITLVYGRNKEAGTGTGIRHLL